MNQVLKQIITAEPRTGKTDMLISMALGYVQRRRSVAIVLSFKSDVEDFKRRHRASLKDGIMVISEYEAFGRSRMIRSTLPDVILLDDLDRFASREGHPLNLIESIYMPINTSLIVVATQTGASDSFVSQAASFTDACRAFGRAIINAIKGMLPWVK
ncbi:ATP-binding protein [Shewanella sp. MBTL60-007]|uniref:ATP-binding protein n=1 Tax=Shewanella sp. MBTL60-007 TaxID=2815911 RepID=UPI001BB97E36|nr:ATP-binding protein [Shewanella sp. MBTL60-007]GIU22182.1 hypothetical protein TUM3792_23970 [Shewanella sp. MBTL60-007]